MQLIALSETLTLTFDRFFSSSRLQLGSKFWKKGMIKENSCEVAQIVQIMGCRMSKFGHCFLANIFWTFCPLSSHLERFLIVKNACTCKIKATHPSTFFRLKKPRLPSPSSLIQLSRGDPETIPGQPDTVSLQRVLGLFGDPPAGGTCPENLTREVQRAS